MTAPVDGSVDGGTDGSVDEPVEKPVDGAVDKPVDGPVSAAARAELIADLHRPFVSRRGRVAAWVTGVGQAIALVACALILPWHGADAVGPWDRGALIALAALFGWALSRYGGVRAEPSEVGLVVRNLLLTRSLLWSEIHEVRFGDEPWVILDVEDGDPVAVMAVQRADGPRSRAEAERLATLVTYHHRAASGRP